LLERIRSERETLSRTGKIKRGKGNSVIVQCGDSSYYGKLPTKWALVQLDDVANIVMGQSPSGDLVTDNPDGVEFHQGKIYFTDRYLACSEQYTAEVNKIAKKDSVLLCVRAPVGIVNITKREISIGRGLCALSPLGGISVEFIFHWLTAFQNSFVAQATGSTFMAITTDVVRQQIVPFPPLAEQKRIVSTIEKLFYQLDKVAEGLN
jgi:type I restriction enzyme S subunit